MAGNHYYHNGKYSPNKARREAQRKYTNGTPEYRKEIDEIGCIVWGVIIGIFAIVFILIAVFKGSENAVNWIK